MLPTKPIDSFQRRSSYQASILMPDVIPTYTLRERGLTYITLDELNKAFLCQNPMDWRYECEIIQSWMPPFPSPDTKPLIMVVRYGTSFLRYSAGPLQGFFWDLYPDDMKTFALAYKAILEAPCPPHLWVVGALQYARKRYNVEGQGDGRTDG